MQCFSKKTTPTVYCNRQGAPSRMVLLTIQNLGIKVDLQYVNTSKGEQNNPGFVKVNPLHQVPVLKIEEQNFSLPESRAIMIFLATVAKSTLYPTDVKKRALVDARLFFDASSTSPAIKSFTSLILRNHAKRIPEEIRESIKTVLSNIETLLTQSLYFAGDELTLADLALLANVETIKAWGAELTDDYPFLTEWYQRCENLKGFSENQEGAKKLAEMLGKILEEPLWK